MDCPICKEPMNPICADNTDVWYRCDDCKVSIDTYRGKIHSARISIRIDLLDMLRRMKDYVEFLNEKYMDKNINEEWPASIDKEAHLKYHLKRVCELVQDLGIECEITMEKIK